MTAHEALSEGEGGHGPIVARRAMGTVIAMRSEVGEDRSGGSARRCLARTGVALMLAVGLPMACGGDDAPAETWSVEAWVCHVPASTESPWYAGLPARREVAAEWFAARVAARVPAYVATVSGGRLRLDIAVGGEVALEPEDGAEECIDRVVSGVDESVHAVVIVADAEHAEGMPGGLGGQRARDLSEVAVDGVGYAYVGAADVAPSWGDDPPMDLVEHELGHALGWLHSGSSRDAYDSALDLMSDSAAPREADPARRDAPWPIAAHLMARGWLTGDEVLLVDQSVGGSTSATLIPLSASGGRRAMVFPLASRGDAVLTIERREPVGYDSHLPQGGLSIHRIEFVVGPTSTGAPEQGDALDWTAVVSIVPLTGPAPFTDLLTPGESLVVDGWTITAGEGGEVTVGLVSAP